MKNLLRYYLPRILIAQALAFLLVAAISLPVLGAIKQEPPRPRGISSIAQPDQPPQLNEINVYENVLEPGDLGMLAEYYIKYTVLPTETATEAYLVIFVDKDGVTQLKSVAPYTFVTSGYGLGCVWMYFSASEVTTYLLDSADIALYRVWICGNPTLSWAGGTPPKVSVTIDSWSTIANPSTIVALKVLYYADILELDWGWDMIEPTPEGNKLTATGQSYFENVIPNLRTIAPACFSSGVVAPNLADIDYTTEFGAVMTDGTGTVAGSPITFNSDESARGTADAGTVTTLVDGKLTQADDYWNGSGLVITSTTDGLAPQGETKLVTDFISANDRLVFGALTAAVDAGDTYSLGTVVNVTAIPGGGGTFTFELAQGTVGTMTNLTGTVTGSPVTLVAGVNTVTVTVIGTFTVNVVLRDTTSSMEDTVIGTGWDLTALATIFGMTRWWFSGVVWLIISVIICAAVFRVSPDQYGGMNAGKVLFPTFIVCIIGGILLGLLKPIVGIVLFISIAGFFVGYILFFRGANA